MGNSYSPFNCTIEHCETCQLLLTTPMLHFLACNNTLTNKVESSSAIDTISKTMGWEAQVLRSVSGMDNRWSRKLWDVYRMHIDLCEYKREEDKGVFAVPIGSCTAHILLMCALMCMLTWDVYWGSFCPTFFCEFFEVLPQV